MRVQFLIGPAGSGKTFCCLTEVENALRTAPTGDPLIFLTPKQATFQIERQLLNGSKIAGYARLHILSFDRLARFVLDKLRVSPPEILSAEGRIMVLRALVMRHEKELQSFHRSARQSGFATELSSVLTELQQQQFTASRLRTLANGKKWRTELRKKLLDLALMLDQYERWLEEHQLQDASQLLDLTAKTLRRAKPAQVRELTIERLWLDGFAEMTPQEQDLLAAIIPFCQSAKLAFCLENESAAVPRLSIWSAIGETYKNCRSRLQGLTGCEIEVKPLHRNPGRSRFEANSFLARLEHSWGQADQELGKCNLEPSCELRVFECRNPKTEATLAAREILKYVKEGNRFRDCAVLFRNLEDYHHVFARTFRRYRIPFFLDRRELVAHHPLTELTRSALRLAVFDWQHDDWFAALKAGFSPVDETEVDRLENQALEFGWHGRRWLEPLPELAAEKLRIKVLPPFERFVTGFGRLRFKPDGEQLAGLIRELWRELGVEHVLERWTLDEAESSAGYQPPAMHATVMGQMHAWLDNLVLAFAANSYSLADWLPILDAGLANLTVGVIPPVLDEVLIGAIDRARNPDLKLAIVAGFNDSVFPAAIPTPPLLTNSDRMELADQSMELGPDIFQQLARERYLGYIACTRAAMRLLISYSSRDSDGKAQNPSPFIGHLQKIFPKLPVIHFTPELNWHEAESPAELIAPFVCFGGSRPDAEPWRSISRLPGMQSLLESVSSLREPPRVESVTPALVDRLYGPVLKSSVSRLEEFAQCPFRFFVHSGLLADERRMFELDTRERGSFQHEVLKLFHDELVSESRRWNELTPADARVRIDRIASTLALTYHHGLLQKDAQSRFEARVLTSALQDFVGTVVGWMGKQYQFEPVKAEFEFGFDPLVAPALRIKLADGHELALHGKIDRIDLHREAQRGLAVVVDYKSSQRRLDAVLVANGIQLQLLAYLAAVRSWPPGTFEADHIEPTGVFYVNLRGQYAATNSRADTLAEAGVVQREAYRHTGRFDASYLDKLDAVGAADQFGYRRNQDGSLHRNSIEALSHTEFLHLLESVERNLEEIGNRIFRGSASVDPYRKGGATACDYCDYRAVCRIDPWTQPWRVLRTIKRSSC